jgi:hypothetical protein
MVRVQFQPHGFTFKEPYKDKPTPMVQETARLPTCPCSVPSATEARGRFQPMAGASRSGHGKQGMPEGDQGCCCRHPATVKDSMQSQEAISKPAGAQCAKAFAKMIAGHRVQKTSRLLVFLGVHRAPCFASTRIPNAIFRGLRAFRFSLYAIGDKWAARGGARPTGSPRKNRRPPRFDTIHSL